MGLFYHLLASLFLITLSNATDPDCTGTIQYLPDIYNCSNYYECDTNREKHLVTCPDGTLWNNNIKTCDYPANVDCSWTVQPTTATSSPTTNPSTYCEKDHEYFPDSTNCRGFYECIDNVKIHKECPVPLFWNVTVTGCAVISDCSQTATTVTAQTSTTVTDIPSTTADPDLVCHVENEYFADNYDCKGYYECIHGYKRHFYCNNDLYWNIHVTGCTPKSDCSQVIYTTTQAPCVEGDVTAYPYNCHSFNYCLNSIWITLDCPTNLYWREATKSCVKIADSDCDKLADLLKK